MGIEFKSRLILFILCTIVSFSKSQSFTDSCTTPKLEIGRCIVIRQCKTILNALSPDLSEEKKAKLKEYLCGYDIDGEHKVCCTDKPIFESDDPSSAIHPNINLLPENCGETAPIIRITKGEKAELFEYPWQVALKYESQSRIPYSCGGSLINKRYVLTAAHCITTRLKLISVRLGEYDLFNTTDCITLGNKTLCAPPVQDFDISKKDAIVHPLYKQHFLHDIALIRLPREAKFNDAVRPICLPISEALTPKQLFRLTVVGWGTTENGTKSSVLLRVMVPYQQNSVCSEAYKSFTQIHDSQLCAGGKDGKDSCGGDSGGPIMVAINVGGIIKTVQLGLVSFGHTRCGIDDVPGVYTRLTSYTDWILDNIKP